MLICHSNFFPRWKWRWADHLNWWGVLQSAQENWLGICLYFGKEWIKRWYSFFLFSLGNCLNTLNELISIVESMSSFEVDLSEISLEAKWGCNNYAYGISNSHGLSYSFKVSVSYHSVFELWCVFGENILWNMCVRIHSQIHSFFDRTLRFTCSASLIRVHYIVFVQIN